MKKVDSNNGVWVNDDPATLTNGTPIDADFMNNIQDEISNVITDNGEILDGTNHSQLSQTLDKTFAKLNSPTLIGVPLTSNPDGTINNQIATVDYVNQKALQATVGFTPTQQGGGTDQGANKIYIGGDSTDATQVRVQVDQTDLGKLAFQAEDDNTYGVSKIGYDHVKGELAYYDTGNKAWHYSYTTDYIDGKAYISSLPTGDNTKVTDIIWNTSSNLPAYYYGADNQVSYSATTDWVNEKFLKLDDVSRQTVTGPVTFSGTTTVSTPTDYTQKQAIGASDADARYARLVGGNAFNGGQSYDSNSYMGSTSAWTGSQLNSPHTVYRVGTAVGHIYTQGTSAASCSLAFVLQPGDGTETDMVLFRGGVLQTSAGQLAFTSQLSQTTHSGNAGDPGSYTITVYTDLSTPSGHRYRISGQTAAYTEEGWQTISLPLTLNGILPGAWGASMFWPTDSGHNNDQVAQITATPTVSTIQVNVDTFGTGTPTWPCYVTWFLEGY